ncbi:MAG: LD-carboxypeptidase [bacterium]|nr:LD-carboxypeptidase [bacterium]
MRRIVPPPLQPGDTIRVIAPSGPCRSDTLLSGIEILSAQGFRVSLPDWLHSHLSKSFTHESEGYLAAPDELRLRDIHDAFTNNEYKAVITTRGGFGVTRLLTQIEWSQWTKPKWFTGFSDTTAFALPLYELLGWLSLTGPVVAANDGIALEGTCWKSWQSLIMRSESQEFPISNYTKNQTSGVLLGGCLSLLTALCGTRFFPNLHGAILFIEDVNEDNYRVDRMLTQLEMCGVFDQIAGIVVGEFCDALGNPQSKRNECTVRRLLELTAHRPEVVVASGLPYGHYRDRCTVTIGADAVIENDTLRITHPVTS